MSLLAELKRRKVFKVGAAYLVVAWLAVQAASIGFPAFDAPPWALRIFILVALLGFPVAVVLAWVFDSTPVGMVLDRPARGGKLVYAAAALLSVLAIGWYFYGQPLFRRGEPAGPGSAGVTANAARAPAAAASPNSIAVLPFTNMSSDAENEYFADGISEELLNVLARIEALKVASRTSAFSFKGKNVPVAEIARTLRVAHVLEGSVRKQGSRVRITAQLIDAGSDEHLWSDTYDRDLTDIFAVQQEIAQSISKELGRVLGRGGALAEVRVERRTADIAAYQAYLSGRELFHRRGNGLIEARRLLEEAVRRDPNFADAWAVLGAIHAVSPSYILVGRDESMALAWDAAEKARSMDDTLAIPYAVHARVQMFRGKILEGEADFAAAIARDPKDSTTYLWRALMYARVGDLEKAQADLRTAVELEPYVGINHGWLGIVLGMGGDRVSGDAELVRSTELGWAAAAYYQAFFALADNRRDTAAALLRSYFTQLQAPQEYREAVIAAVLDPASLPRLPEVVAHMDHNTDGIGPASMLAMLGLHREAIARSLAPSATREDVGAATRWFPTARAMIERPDYLELAARDGFMDWWQARGFPAGCKLVETEPRHLDCAERWQATANRQASRSGSAPAKPAGR